MISLSSLYLCFILCPTEGTHLKLYTSVLCSGSGGGVQYRGKHQIYHSLFHLGYGKNQKACVVLLAVCNASCFWCETDDTPRHMNNQEHNSVLPSSFSSQMEPKLAWTESVLHEYQQGICTVECWVGCTVRCLTSMFFICRFLHRCSY